MLTKVSVLYLCSWGVAHSSYLCRFCIGWDCLQEKSQNQLYAIKSVIISLLFLLHCCLQDGVTGQMSLLYKLQSTYFPKYFEIALFLDEKSFRINLRNCEPQPNCLKFYFISAQVLSYVFKTWKKLNYLEKKNFILKPIQSNLLQISLRGSLSIVSNSISEMFSCYLEKALWNNAFSLNTIFQLFYPLRMAFLATEFLPIQSFRRYVWSEPDFPLHQTSSKWTYLQLE